VAHTQAELEHLKSLPPTSHKWTWGVDITENDVLASNQKTKGKGKSHHSGYIQSLPHGVYKKEWLITASIPTVSAAYSRPPTVTGIDAGLYFSDTELDNLSHADTESNAASAAVAVPTPAADVNMTASDASMAWQGEDNRPTAFQAAIAWQGDDDHNDSSPHTASPTAFDAAAFFSADSTSSSPSTHTAAFPTALDAADLFLSSSDTNSAGSRDSNANADANANTDAESDVEDISSAESPTTSQIERCTPSHVILPIYSHADFSYIDDTWLPGSDDMMDTSKNE
jgi:hypothetical protein